MIFVTTGFHVPFERLFRAADALAGRTGEEVVVQGRNETGFVFEHARHAEVYDNVPELMRSARVVVCHGAMTLVEAVQMGVSVVAVPRLQKFGEHIDDHQVDFAKCMAQQYRFPVVEDTAELPLAIEEAARVKPLPFSLRNRERLQGFLAGILQLNAPATPSGDSDPVGIMGRAKG